MPIAVVTGVEDPALNFGLTLLEVKPVSNFHFWPDIRVKTSFGVFSASNQLVPTWF